MTPETYIARMAELGINREGLERIQPFDTSTVNKAKEPTYLNEKASMIPMPPPGGDEDLSRFNSRQWHTLKARGKTTGRPKK